MILDMVVLAFIAYHYTPVNIPSHGQEISLPKFEIDMKGETFQTQLHNYEKNSITPPLAPKNISRATSLSPNENIARVRKLSVIPYQETHLI